MAIPLSRLGVRVVRGPDWEWGDQDGGEGFVGTVAGLEEGGDRVVVQWDMGLKCRYRCGADGKFDLRVLDSGPSGHRFTALTCHVCREEGVWGTVWKCIHCSEYYLCSACYLAGHHSMAHRFDCLLTREGKGIRVTPRSESRRVPARGVFPGATVVRGPDWRWGDQDGGEGRVGEVGEVKGWNKDSERSVVAVVWQEKGSKKNYRLGYKGKVDIKCVSPGDGGLYYPEHLPPLGGQPEAPASHDFTAGDKIRCDVDMELLGSLQDNQAMAEKISLMLDNVGTVNSLLEDGDLLVRYPNNTLLPVNTQAANKVDMPMLESGDVVRMISDMAEVYRLQQGHGEWNDDMALCLGQVGSIVKTVGDGNVLVTIAGYRWVLNPCCLQPAPGEELSPDANPGRQLLSLGGMGSLGLLSMVEGLSEEFLVHATSAGDLATVQAYLDKNPHQVNVTVQGKTAVHVAVEEARLNILKVLLTFKPNLAQVDGDGDTPLHSCAFLNAVQAAAVLLDAGADMNTRNHKRNITPVMIAGAVGHFSLLKLMASHPSADVNVQDLQGQSALHHTIRSQRTRAIPILLTAGADPSLLNANLFSPLMDAAGLGFLPAVEDILRKCPELKDMRRPADNHTPLHIACVNSRLHTVRHLALSGCDMSLRNDLERTALHMTSIEGHSQVMECLVGYGVDINAQDHDGNTTLHIVLVKKNARPLSHLTPQMNKIHNELSRLPLDSVPVFLTVACFLVQEGAHMHLRNKHGMTVRQACPEDKRDVLINYINKSNRGEFHGSLRNDRTASSAENAPLSANNKPNLLAEDVAKAPPSTTSATTDNAAAVSSEQSKGGMSIDAQSSEQPDSRSIGQSDSIMETQHTAGGGGHRERDRLRLLEERRQTPPDVEPHVLSVVEREDVRKRREAYFGARAPKGGQKDTAVHVEPEKRGVKDTDTVEVQTSEVKDRQRESVSREKSRYQKETGVGTKLHIQTKGEAVSGEHKTRDEQGRRVSKQGHRIKGNETATKSQKHSERWTRRRPKEKITGEPKLAGTKPEKKWEPSSLKQGRVQEEGAGVTKTEKEQKKQTSVKGSGLSVKERRETDRVRETTVSGTTQQQYKDGETTVSGTTQQYKDGANAAEPCFVCEEPADASFIPCGHVVACKTCASRAKRCPICRAEVKGVS